MTPTERKRVDSKLRRQGFDRIIFEGKWVRPRCSPCEVLVINGVACHESGCSHQKKEKHDDEE